MKKVVFVSACAVLGINGFAENVITEDVSVAETESLKNKDLHEVVVKGTKAHSGTPIAFTNLSKDEISKNNFGQDIPYLISQTPNVIVTSDAGTGIGYTGFRVRGTDANRINVTVNGVPLNDSESHTVFWVNMPDFASSVENVQIQRGAGTSTNGAASFGATIGMETSKPNLKPYAEYDGAGGSFKTFKNTFRGGTGLLYDHFVFDARYSKIDSDGFIDRAKARMSSYYGSAAYYGASTLIRFQAFGSSEKTNQAWNGVPSDSIKAGNRTYNNCGEYTEIDKDGNKVVKYYDQTDNYWQNHYHLSAAHTFSNNLDMNVTLHYTKGKGYYEDYKADAEMFKYNLTPFVDGDGNTVKRTDLVRRKWLKNDFYGAIYNANYKGGFYNLNLGAGINNYDGNHFGNVIWAKNYNNLINDERYYDSDASKLDFNVFLKGNFNITKNLSVYGDMQYRHINYKIKGTNDNFDYDDVQQYMDIKKKYDFFNPKAGLNYSVNGHNAFASFAVAHREPNRNNFTDAGINDRPTYETLYDYEAGYNYTGKGWQVGANLYYMDYDNQLILTGKLSEIGEALTSNIKDSYRMGIELSGAVKICSWVSWKGNVSFSKNKIRNFTETVDMYDSSWEWVNTQEVFYKKTNIAFSPDVVANSIFDFGYKGFSASFSTVFVGKQYLDNTSCDDRSLGAYCVNNLQLGYSFKPKFMKQLDLYFRINNIFNEKYETNGWVYSAVVDGAFDLNNRYKEDGLFTQAGTNVMASLRFSF